MPTYKIIFEKEAQKFLDKQDKNKRMHLYRAIYKLPEGTDIKKLKGCNNLYRLRVGDCRILYTVDEVIKLIDIENIDNRGDVYKRI
ncbi:MAG: type II toxin-antitoxin system RelE/ParE family toxin [Bacteroidales bacterium]|nr:type II toxin-antitoxin system RelE/ParE family toxin [Lachnoclostridium sp.]MCM1385137.1 type II toxin-antitoxin system RelE/ParE family toxin [Lachnoclostridium sp.]MCM1465539.1 type II toxin-antitoxin system RelE/ParE family toxin [Bacteroidales bacterium]MCM1536069.1 type II toxin-antitoxin system RelE/ParE family toxin [Clostridium sp.]